MVKKYYLDQENVNPEIGLKIDINRLYNDFEVHSHDFYEYIVILSGSVIHRIKDQDYLAQPGDVFIMAEDTQHGFYEPQNLKLLNLKFNPDMLLSKFPELEGIPQFHVLFKNHQDKDASTFSNRSKLTATSMAKIEDIAYRMLDEQEVKKSGYSIFLRVYFFEMLMITLRDYEIFAENREMTIINMANTISYIEKNYHKHLLLKDLAEKTNMSSRTFNRVFKRHFTLTPFEYIARLRVKKACNLLRYSDMTIMMVASESGFSDSNYFSRVFKRVMGMSPSDYRKKI